MMENDSELDEEIYFKIKPDEYFRLKENSERYESLQAYGVDNWQGYDDAMQYYYQTYVKEK